MVVKRRRNAHSTQQDGSEISDGIDGAIFGEPRMRAMSQDGRENYSREQ